MIIQTVCVWIGDIDQAQKAYRPACLGRRISWIYQGKIFYSLQCVPESRDTLRKKWSDPLRLSSRNVSKAAENCGFSSNLLKKSLMKNFFLCSDSTSTDKPLDQYTLIYLVEFKTLCRLKVMSLNTVDPKKRKHPRKLLHQTKTSDVTTKIIKNHWNEMSAWSFLYNKKESTIKWRNYEPDRLLKYKNECMVVKRVK